MGVPYGLFSIGVSAGVNPCLRQIGEAYLLQMEMFGIVAVVWPRPFEQCSDRGWDYRPMAVKPDDPDEVRAKARETRLRAQIDTDPELRQVLVRVAAEYDELANAIEREMANLRPRR
jgi:hypothetical protein